MIIAEKPFDELGRAPELYIEAARRFRERVRPLDPAERFSYADALRKAGRIEEAAGIFRSCGEKGEFFASRLSGLDCEVFSEMRQGPCPAPIVLLPGFLASDEKEGLMNFFLGHEREFTRAPDGLGGYDPAVRNNLELAGSRSVKQPFREKIIGALPRIFRRMGIDPFQPKKIEVKLRAYRDRQYFRIHADAEAGRRLTFVYHFFGEKSYDGGDLLVFDTAADGKTYSRDFTRLVPRDNCLCFFPSFYYHAVTPVVSGEDFRSARFAVNGHVSADYEIL